jgi:high frequency lysogenization protein
VHPFRDRVIALAGVFQAAWNVRAIASRGKEMTPAVEASINSLFKIDAESVEDVYGGLAGIQDGLHSLCDQLSSDNSKRDIELARYVISLLYLERKLGKQSAYLQQLTNGIQSAVEQAEYFSTTHTNVIANLADLYQETISQMTPRIMVSGEPEILTNPDNANLIRALLLAGIRSAMLWRQCGGSRWQLLFKRKKLVQTASWLLKNI